MSLSFIPIKAGTKQPAFSWKQYQQTPAGDAEVRQWTDAGYSLAAVTGAVSGNLEVIDFDAAELLKPWTEKVRAYGFGDQLAALGVVQTGKGWHVYYRCDQITGSQKLAVADDGTALIETRGEGGYVVCPNDNDARYQWMKGGYGRIPTIRRKFREVLLEAAREFNQLFRESGEPTIHLGRGKPGEDFNDRGSWGEILEPLGWQCIRTRADGVTEWTRPGKTAGVSATTGHHGTDYFHLFSSSVEGLEPGRSYSKFAVYTACNHAGSFEDAARELAAKGFGDSLSDKNGGSGSQIQSLLDIADGCEYILSRERIPFVRLDAGTFPIEGNEFIQWLDNKYRLNGGKPAGENCLRDATKKIARAARINGSEQELFLRVGYGDKLRQSIYVDLGRNDRKAVEITADGWKVTVDPVVHFKRTAAVGLLPTPESGGDINALRQYINVPNDEQWILFVSWLVGCYSPFGTYPILIIQGDSGSAKSTATRILRQIIDPALPALLPYPKSPDVIVNHAFHNHLLTYDNLSGVSNDVSDALCTVASGSGFATRELYTNFGRAAFEFKRPVALNGIDNIARRNDLASRSLALYFHRVADGNRLTEAEVDYGVERILPGVLGAVFDAVAMALKNFHATDLGDLNYRISDWVKWSLASLPALPWGRDDYLRAMAENERVLTESVLNTDLVAQYVVQFMGEREEWEGKCTDLYELVENFVSDRVRRSREWPDSPIGFGMRLTRAHPLLESLGIELAKVQRNRQSRSYRIVNHNLRGVA